MCLGTVVSYGQGVGISNTNNTPDPEAILDIQSTTKGVLLPRMTTAQATTLGASLDVNDNGMIIYDVTANEYKYWTNPSWNSIGTSSGSNSSTDLSDTDDDTKVQVEEGSDEDKIRFDTEGVQRMIIDNAGKVAIGATSPYSAFEVYDSNGPSITITKDGADASNIFFRNGTGGGVNDGARFGLSSAEHFELTHSISNKDMFFNVNVAGTPTNVLFIDGGTGRVGVKNIAPAYDLEVGGDIGVDTEVIHAGDDDTKIQFTTNRIQMFAGSSTSSWIDIQSTGSELTINENDLQRDFRVEGGTEENLLFIDGSADRIGVATDAPTTELDVNGTIRMRGGATSGYVVVSDANGLMTWTDPANVSAGALLEDTDGDTKIQLEESSDEDMIRFSTDNSERMIIDNFGKVGIGTPLPQAALEIRGIAGSATFSQIITKNSNLSNELIGIGFGAQASSSIVKSGIVHERISANGLGKLHFLVDNSLDANDVTLAESRITIDENSNVGIATASPTQTLDVNGQIRMRTGATTGYVPVGDANGVMTWVDPSTLSTTTNTLDDSYDQGGAGAGRQIEATDGAVRINGDDGFIVTGAVGSGDAIEVSGAGTRMFFNPKKAAFRSGSATGAEWDDSNVGNYSVAMGESTTASGPYSTAMGQNTTASGTHSIAMGRSTTASGLYSTAMGSNTTASNTFSTAMGFNTTASANFSTAMGQSTTAPSYAETAIGAYNTTYLPTGTTSWNSADRLFVIGNGTGTGASSSNAMVVLKNGKTGIGTSTPQTELHVVGDMRLSALAGGGSVVADTDGNLVLSGSLPGGDLDYVQNQSVLAQTVSEYWISGDGRLDGGLTVGSGATIDNSNSNNGTIASAALAFGSSSGEGIASKRTSGGNQDGLDFYTASTNRLAITNSGNVGMGTNTPETNLEVRGTEAGMIVHNVGQSRGGLFALSGQKVALATTSASDDIIFGYTTLANPDGMTSTMSIDNGTGDVTITGKFNSNGIAETSDKRFKKDIQGLTGALENLEKLNGVSYNWKVEEFPERNFSDRTEIGVIAQELEKVYPELVSTDKNGYKSVQYSHLVPVLIEAIKDQQKSITGLESNLAELTQTVNELANRFNFIGEQQNSSILEPAQSMVGNNEQSE
jgi:hypothetical protein